MSDSLISREVARSRRTVLRKLGLGLCIGLIGCSLGGCVFIQTYPEQWDALPPPQSGCPIIAGTYVNRGTRDDSIYALSSLLGATPYLQVMATHVSIEQPDDATLLMRYWKEGNLESTQTLSRSAGDYTCTGGWIERKKSVKSGSVEKGGMFAIVGYANVRFVATADYLIAESYSGGVGGMVPIPNPYYIPPFPIAAYENHWCRFKRTQPAESASPPR